MITSSLLRWTRDIWITIMTWYSIFLHATVLTTLTFSRMHFAFPAYWHWQSILLSFDYETSVWVAMAKEDRCTLSCSSNERRGHYREICWWPNKNCTMFFTFLFIDVELMHFFSLWFHLLQHIFDSIYTTNNVDIQLHRVQEENL
jgi:hypothetical protein